MTKAADPPRRGCRVAARRRIGIAAPAEQAGGCPARDLVELHALGRLEAAEAQRVAEHLHHCQRCSAYHALDVRFIAALRTSLRPGTATGS